MDTVIVSVIAAVFASSGLWALFTAIYQNRSKRESAEDKAIKALLHDRIFDISKELIARGSVSMEEYDNLKYLYEPYVELGGNGTCKRLKDEVDKLPIVD